MLTSYCCKTDC